jgi:hypothetical protein
MTSILRIVGDSLNNNADPELFGYDVLFGQRHNFPGIRCVVIVPFPFYNAVLK